MAPFAEKSAETQAIPAVLAEKAEKICNSVKTDIEIGAENLSVLINILTWGLKGIYLV